MNYFITNQSEDIQDNFITLNIELCTDAVFIIVVIFGQPYSKQGFKFATQYRNLFRRRLLSQAPEIYFVNSREGGI